ncbi:MAG: hypothetical protein EU536_02020 [Promethearchaeota archaeon]|nr:MAG: hypothetical protein EU536_02020 [Candidatus Lokiarchaeota archaeon]
MQIRPMDRDFIQTKEGFFFCIIGYTHPPERAISYLKYVPAESGKWKSGNQMLQRVLPHYSAQAVLNTFQFLESKYPEYLFYDEYSDITFSAVPYRRIKTYFSTRAKLAQIMNASKLDPLQTKLTQFILVLSERSGVPVTSMGITGSLLLEIHNPQFSDLDLTVHGVENALKMKDTLKELFDQNDPEIQRLDASIAIEWQKDKASRFGFSLSEAKVLFERKWNMGMFQNTRFSIHPIKTMEELDDNYGEKRYLRGEPVEIRAKVVKVNNLFMPSVYEVADVEVVSGIIKGGVREVISYEGLFDAAAEKGEYIRASGRIERVIDLKGKADYHRLVIGSKGENSHEFIVAI